MFDHLTFKQLREEFDDAKKLFLASGNKQYEIMMHTLAQELDLRCAEIEAKKDKPVARVIFNAVSGQYDVYNRAGVFVESWRKSDDANAHCCSMNERESI